MNLILTPMAFDWGVVATFGYLRSTLSWNGSLDAEIHSRIQKASVAFDRLEKRLLSDDGVTFQIKVTVPDVCTDYLTILIKYMDNLLSPT